MVRRDKNPKLFNYLRNKICLILKKLVKRLISNMPGSTSQKRFTPEEDKFIKENFLKKFSKNEIPDNIPEKILKTKEAIPLANILKDIDMVSSTSEALRLINQGAVKIDQQKIESKDYDFGLDEKKLVQIGKKKFIYLTLKKH